MEQLEIQSHNFQEKILKNKSNYDQKLNKLELKKVDEEKGTRQQIEDFIFGRGFCPEHVVTGKEFNTLIEQLQPYLHNFNGTQIDLYKELGEVYSLLEGLDKDYIQAIIVSIKAAEETSKGIQNTQNQIESIVKNQKQTIEKLKEFKQKIDSYTHLKDIDSMWYTVNEHSKQMNVIEQQGSVTVTSMKKYQEEIDRKIEKVTEESNSKIESLKNKIAFTYWVAGGALGIAIIEMFLLLQ